MLTITPQALSVMRRVTGHPTMGPTSGLRIDPHDDSDETMQVGAVRRPQPGDSVLERDGARLYLGQDAAHHVEGRRLDAVTDPGGRVHFILKSAG